MKVNDIFYLDDDYSSKAEFANINGYKIKELEPDSKGRRFQIVEDIKSEQTIITSEIMELKLWFEEYDKQIMQYQRSQRLGEEFDKDINELDAQAKTNAARIKELREILQAQE